jgi:hypothetical protein
VSLSAPPAARRAPATRPSRPTRAAHTPSSTVAAALRRRQRCCCPSTSAPAPERRYPPCALSWPLANASPAVRCCCTRAWNHFLLCHWVPRRCARRRRFRSPLRTSNAPPPASLVPVDLFTFAAAAFVWRTGSEYACFGHACHWPSTSTATSSCSALLTGLPTQRACAPTQHSARPTAKPVCNLSRTVCTHQSTSPLCCRHPDAGDQSRLVAVG